MEATSHILDKILREAQQLGRVLEFQSFDYSPVLLTQPPSHRDARRRDLSDAVALLDLQWTKFESIKVQIEDARIRLQQQRALCRSALSPIFALPQEVLTEIFHYSTRYEPASPNERPSRRIGALSQVCRDWRVVGLQQKHAWAFAEIQGVADLPRLQFPMERCGEGDFTLTVGAKPMVDMAISALDVSDRLQHYLVNLEWHSSAQIESFFKHLKSSSSNPLLTMKSLQRLAIRSPYPNDEIDTVLIDVDFPQLLSLTLDRVWIKFVQKDAFRNVRHIVLSDILIRSSILRICLEEVCDLRELQLRNCRSNDGSLEFADPRQIGQLETLKATRTSTHTVSHLMDSYIFKGLRNLSLAMEECDHEHPSFVPNSRGYHTRTDFNNSLNPGLFRMWELTTVSLHLAFSNLRAAVRGLSTILGLETMSRGGLRKATLLEVEIIIADCHCEEERLGNCIGNNHGRERAQQLGMYLVRVLEKRGCLATPLESLYVSECMVQREPMERMVQGPLRTKECRSCRSADAEQAIEKAA